jgi:HEAT repeat protein
MRTIPTLIRNPRSEVRSPKVTRNPHPASALGRCGLPLLLAFALSSHAGEPLAPSTEKARQALAVLQSDAPPQDKAMACKRIAIYGGPEAVPSLAPLLADEQLASWARIPLEVLPGPAPDDALREALGRLQGNLLVGVINSIGVRGDAKAVSGLIVRLQDPDAEVASAAAVALGRIGGTQAVNALQAALPASPAGVRSAVAEGLILCAERFSTTGQAGDAVKLYDAILRADVPKQRMLEATRGAILALGNAGLPRLLETLRSADKASFAIALRTARELPGRAVTEALAAELNQTPPARQSQVLLALTDRGDAAVWPAVFNAVKNGSKSLRMVAIGVLERQGNVASLPVLLEAATDTDNEVSKAAKAALGRLPGQEVDAEIAARLPQASLPTRRVLVELAGQRRVTAAVPELFKAAGDTDAALRGAGIKALGETVAVADLGALADLLPKAQSAEELANVEAALDSACTRLPDKAACAAPLLARFPASPAPARSALLRVLGAVATPEALAAVRSSLTHADATVRDAAFRTLADWPETTALPALLEVIRATSDDTQRTLALRGAVRLLALGGQPLAQIVKTYGELLGLARRVEDRKLVLSGLGTVPDPAAVPLVEPLLAESAVQREAELALLSIASNLAGSAPAAAQAVARKLQTVSQQEATRERAGQILQQIEKVEDFITAWQVSGPYTQPAPRSSLFATAYAPEQPDGKASWRPLTAGTQAARPWMLDLLAALQGERRVGYARTWVYSEKAQPARLEFGTDDGHKLWFNGKLVAEANRGGAAVPGDFKANVELRPGWNTILLKVIQDTGPWEFCLRLRTPGGGRLEGLRIQAVPPGE